jgi:hypothetical protein
LRKEKDKTESPYSDTRRTRKLTKLRNSNTVDEITKFDLIAYMQSTYHVHNTRSLYHHFCRLSLLCDVGLPHKSHRYFIENNSIYQKKQLRNSNTVDEITKLDLIAYMQSRYRVSPFIIIFVGLGSFMT